MALADLYGKILAMGAKVIRSHTVMPALINHASMEDETSPKPQGGDVEIIVPPEFTARDVTPGSTPPASDAPPNPTTVKIPLDYWKEVNFPLTEKHINLIERADEQVPLFLANAAATLADEISLSILQQYPGVYGWAGTAGVTPFGASILEAQEAKKVLTVQKCPKQMRQIVLSHDAYANATGLSAFRSALEFGDREVILEGELTRAYGFSWHEDANIQEHATTGAGGTTGGSAGDTTLTITGGTLPGVGDVFTIAGHDQTYAVTAIAGSTISIAPALRVDVPSASALTYKGDHVVNLAFHPYAFAFASRPAARLNIPELNKGQLLATWVDDLTGVVLRLVIKDEYHQTGFYLSCLWGTELVDARLATRIGG